MKQSLNYQITDTYFPHESNEFILHKINENPRRAKNEYSKEEDKVDESDFEYGLFNAATRNDKYKSMVLHAGLKDMDNNEIIDEYFKWIYSNKTNQKQKKIDTF